MLYEKLFDYQKAAVDTICVQPSTALLFDQGTGKTWVTAGIIEKLLHPKAEYLLIVPLTNIDTTWVKTLSQFKDLAIFKDFNEYKAYRDGPKLFLTHYEGLPKFIDKLCRVHWTLIALDESQRIKGRNTQQSKRAARLKLADHKVILSGTPIDKSPIDMWAQFRFVAPEVFGTRWKDFEEEYCYKTGFMGKEIKFRVKKMPEFLEKLKPYCIRVVKSDVLDLPPMEIILSPVDLLGKQLRIYDEMNSEMITSLEGQTLAVDLKITQIAKLQQICGGFILNEDREVLAIGRAKVRRVTSLIKTITAPVVIFCKYLEEIEIVARELSHLKLAILCGKTKNRAKMIEDFQDGLYDVIICQIKTGGVGIDLFRSCNVIFYSLTYSFIDYEQALARVHRHGQTKEVKIYLIYAKNTIDEAIYEAILSKKSISDTVLKSLKGVTHGKRKSKS